MKFWMFSDARISGPFTREELAGMESVHSGTLVCKEGDTGVADGDWQALEAVPELAGLAFVGAPAGGPASSSFFETLDPHDPASASWPPAFEDDPRFNFWMRDEYEAGRTVELERTLAEMREQLARHERRQDEILDHLNAKDSVLGERERELRELRARLARYESGEAPPPAARAPAPKAAPAAKAAPPAAAPAKPAVEPPQPAAAGPSAPPPAAKAPALEPPAAPPALDTPAAPPPAAEAPPTAAAPVEEDADSPARQALKAARAARKGLPQAPMELSLGAPEEAVPSAEMPILEPPAPVTLDAPAFGLEPPAAAPPAPEAATSLGIPDSESLSPVTDVPPPLDFAPPLPEHAGALAAEPPPLEPPALEPPPFDAGAPAHAEAPQTMLFQGEQGSGIGLTPSPMPLGGTPGPVPLGGTPPPMSLGGTPGPAPFGATPEPIPLGGAPLATPMPAMGQPDLPQNVMQGLGVAGQATPYPFGQQTPLPRLPGQDMAAMESALTAPPPLSSAPGQPPTVPPTAAGKLAGAARFKEALRSKKSLVILAVAVLALGGIFSMFLRNPKQLSRSVDMAPEQKTQGTFNEASPAPPSATATSPFQKRPQTPGVEVPGQEATPAAPPPATTAAPGTASPFPASTQPAAPAPASPFPASPQPAAPAPAPAAPPPGPDYVNDKSVEAIEFVKDYKLDPARGTVGAYLQYAFLGPDSVPQWRAGAIDQGVYMVEFDVYKGLGQGGKPVETFRFEADLVRKTLKGANPSAKEMLEGSSPAPARHARTRHHTARRPRPRRKPVRSGPPPLPTDAELDKAAGGGAGGFNNPGD